MNIHRILLTVVATITAGALHAQTIKGKVVDATSQEPIIGATIIIGNDKKGGTVTDINGQFSIKAKELPVVINVNYAGYRSQEIDVYDDAEPLTVELAENSNLLETVVVLGYTQVKRQNLTGSISSVKAADISATAASSFNEKIQGQAPGLIISGTSGTPGSSVFIRLRGTTSINAGNDPLYIIDGVPINSQPLQTISNGGQTINPISDLNPDDIESIEILKDANATAIYGARGANGVILVKTKHGERNQKTRVTFNAEYGFAKAAKLWDLATGPDHAQILNEAWINDGKDPNLIPYRPK